MTIIPDSEAATTRANYAIGTSNSVTIGVDDNDDAVTASIVVAHNAPEDSGQNTDRAEADQLVVSLNTGSARVVKVDYTFTDVSATIGTDFTTLNDTPANDEPNGTLTFTPSESTNLTVTSLPIPFMITQDELVELGETFTISLSIPSDGNAILDENSKTVTVTIVDDDIPELSVIAGADVTEGSGNKAHYLL